MTQPAAHDTTGGRVRRAVRRHRMAMATGVAVFAAVALWTLLSTPRYRSAALIRIRSAQQGPSLPDALSDLPGVGLLGLGRDDIETEIGVLKSQRMLDAVLDSLRLAVRVEHPAAGRDSATGLPYVTVRRDDAAPDSAEAEGTLTLVQDQPGAYRITAARWMGAPAPPPRVAVGDSLRAGPWWIRVHAIPGAGPPGEVRLRVMPRYRAEEAITKRLDIRRQEGNTRLVQVAFEDPDRRMAAAVVRTLVSAYEEYTLRNTMGDDGRRLEELRRETAAWERNLAATDEKLRQFKEQRRLSIPEEQATAQLKRLAAAQGALDALEVERDALARLLALVEARAQGADDPSAWRQLATFPSLIGNRGVQDVLLALLELENERSSMGIRRAAVNDEMRQLATRISELEQQLRRVGNQYLEGLGEQVAAGTATVKALSADLDAFPRDEMALVRLLRDRTLLAEGFAVLKKQLVQAELQAAMRSDLIQVVDAPRVADARDPAFPRTAVQLVLGAILGAAVGVVVAVGGALAGSPSAGIQASSSITQKVGSASVE
jgi:uncharacterized protein involved in exopolysaccharide biosynthesis